jgi:uncharacterized Zn-binding protein involved in type VI secretion
MEPRQYAACRLGDNASAHDQQSGPAVSGSRNVAINNRPAVRIGDHGVAKNGSSWVSTEGSNHILINGRHPARINHTVRQERRPGHIVTGSNNVALGNNAAHIPKPTSQGEPFTELTILKPFLDPSALKHNHLKR